MCKSGACMNKQVDLTTAGMQIQGAAGPGYTSTLVGSSLLQSRENSKALSVEAAQSGHNQDGKSGHQCRILSPATDLHDQRPCFLLLLPQIAPFHGYRLCQGEGLPLCTDLYSAHHGSQLKRLYKMETEIKSN